MHELEVLLSRLKMEHLSYHVESLLEQAAKKELNYREFLCMALQQEWNGRHQRGMESRLKQARLPWVKTLEQFDFTFQPGIYRKVVRELAGLAFVERSENVILLVPPGVGKTHLAIALGVKAVDAGHRVLFMPLDRLIATLMKAKQENRLERQLQQLSYARVLILDEIGYLPMNREDVGNAFMRGVSSPMRVTQEGPDGLSRYCPVRVICLEIQLCFLTGALLWQVKLRKPLLWVAWIYIKICTLPLS